MNFTKQHIYGITIGVSALIVLSSSIFNVKAGTYVMEQTPSGELVPHMTPGYKMKVPFFSTVNEWNEVTTIIYNEQSGDATSQNPPYNITFADTYNGNIEGSFRVELPKNPDKFIELYKAFKHYDNFVENGAEKFTNELLSYTAMQFTAEEFMQGGKNEFKTRLEDQARRGLYEIKRVASKVSSKTNDPTSSGQIAENEIVVYKNEIQRDESGQAIRKISGLSSYGINIPQVTVERFIPEQALEIFMNNKKQRVQERAKLIEDQENERQRAITAKLAGDRARIEQKQQALMEKDKAVIEQTKKVEMAKLQAEKELVDKQKEADLAVIEKAKELQIAKANEGIQQANATAAIHEANAIKAKGLAEAEVIGAMLKAKQDNKDIVLAELQRDNILAISKNLKDFKIEMPTYMAGSSNGANSNSLDVLLNAVGINNLQQLKSDSQK
jgi:hypothetical protein